MKVKSIGDGNYIQGHMIVNAQTVQIMLKLIFGNYDIEHVNDYIATIALCFDFL